VDLRRGINTIQVGKGGGGGGGGEGGGGGGGWGGGGGGQHKKWGSWRLRVVTIEERK